MARWPVHQNPNKEREAKAPYNFVPLPDKVILAQKPLDQDVYHQGAHSGWIVCDLTTRSPTYVRGMMTEAQYRTIGQKAADLLTVAEKIERSQFYNSSEATVEGHPVPVIPGSSLRGMVRTLVEIAGYGRMRGVADKPTFTFRAVAASNDDPLRAPYQRILGKYGKHIKAGYLVLEGEQWYIAPASTPSSVGLHAEKSTYLKVKERLLQTEIPGALPFDSAKYRPGFYRVTFDAEEKPGKHGRYVAITRVGSPQLGHRYRYEGFLVCSGNMKETNQEGASPRKNHALVLLPDVKARALPIPEQRIRDYLAGLTAFQKQELWGGANGCLVDGAPVFYAETDGQVVVFGHCPNFRVPALLPDGTRATTPRDFVPSLVTRGAAPDLADAIFGWVEDDARGIEDQRAGRVTFGDAHYMGASEEGVWCKTDPITPHVLSGPKPTTFQHYLVQDAKTGHAPRDKVALAHWGTSPLETQIRGHKLYWHKGAEPDIEANAKEREHESQLTRIVPVRPEVCFQFKICFENLRDEELGALLWALILPGAPDRVYCHKMGMGKPLGMGAVYIEPRLWLTDRPARYGQGFVDGTWYAAAVQHDCEPFVMAFEEYVLGKKGRLYDLERIQMLFAMLQWQEQDEQWIETTRYMEIKHGDEELNEYTSRPVLPDPLAVLAGQTVEPPASRRPSETQPSSGGKAPPATAEPGESRGESPAAPETRKQEYQTGTVTYFNLIEERGTVLMDETGAEVEFGLEQLRRGTRFLSKNNRVSFRVIKDADGIRVIDVGTA